MRKKNHNLSIHPAGFLVLREEGGGLSPDAIVTNKNRLLLLDSDSIKNELSSRKFKEIQKNAVYNKQLLTKILPDFFSFGESSIKSNPEKFSRVNCFSDVRYRNTSYFKNSVSPLHLYPFVSTHKKETPDTLPRVKEFVFASCLFGAALRGIDYNGDSYPLINHNLKVDDILVKVKVDQQLHPYELMMFAVFEESLELISKSFGKNKPTIRYHLPVKDYFLYGLRLYIAGFLTYPALVDYIKAVKVRGKMHQEKLEVIAGAKGFELLIESPFDNFIKDIETINLQQILYSLALTNNQIQAFIEYEQEIDQGDLLNRIRRVGTRKGYCGETDSSSSSDENSSDEEMGERQLFNIKHVIDTLNVWDDCPMKEQGYSARTKQIRERYESYFVQNLLDRLVNNNYQEDHQAVWGKILLAIDYPKSLEDVFKFANAAMLAIARNQKGINDFEICSFLPIDERPIIIHYNKAMSKIFGHISGLISLTPILNYLGISDDLSQKDINLRKVPLKLFTFRQDLSQLSLRNFSKKLKEIKFQLNFTFSDKPVSEKQIISNRLVKERQLISGMSMVPMICFSKFFNISRHDSDFFFRVLCEFFSNGDKARSFSITELGVNHYSIFLQIPNKVVVEERGQLNKLSS